MAFDFMQNRECPFFPCHSEVIADSFSCLFCYCPLYPLGDKCGGDFVYTEKGIKDCSGCVRPHLRENYGEICNGLAAVIEMVKKPDGNT